MLKEKIGFIGGGKMGEALCKGLINAKLSIVDQIMVSDVSVERCKLLSQEIGVRTTRDNKEIVSFADIIVLGERARVTS